jgi:hypothetical protein
MNSTPHYPTIPSSAMTNDDHSAIRSSTQVRATISLCGTVIQLAVRYLWYAMKTNVCLHIYRSNSVLWLFVITSQLSGLHVVQLQFREG